MRTRIQHLRRDERGIAYMYIGLGFMAFIGATTLAVDVGMLMTARSQAQNAADAGALAGAIALVYNDFDDRSASGPAVQSALGAARANQVMSGTVAVEPSDVTFPTGPTGLNNRVHVNVFRTAQRTNPLPTLMARLFGQNTVDINAGATAEASPSNAATCLLPFTLPDRWDEITAGPWNPESQFDYLDKHGNLVSPRDVYTSGPTGTGYNAERDKGTQLILKTDNSSKVAPSIYNPWRIGPNAGADDYRQAISGCRTDILETDTMIDVETGNMTGPTKQGFDELFAQDPFAKWDTTCNCVVGSAHEVSPRIRTIPLYDPVVYEQGKQSGGNVQFKIVSFLGVFVEKMQGGEIWARIHPTTALTTGNNTTQSSFAMSIRLVE
jgi:Flp pilus assembly protein TadG